MDRIVLAPHAGGLGDMLLYSTLPQRYAQRGDEVYIASNPAPRNLEAYDLVFGRNPYVSGVLDAPANAGGWIFKDYAIIREAKRLANPILAVEHLHGFDRDVYSRVVPRIYADVGRRAKWLDRVVADPRSISQSMSPKAFGQFARWVCRWHGYDEDAIIVLDSKYAGPSGADSLPNNERYVVRDIYEYAEILLSAKAALVTESGGQVLAAALRPALPTYAIFTTMAYNDRLFTFPNVTYYVTGQMSPDYHGGYV